MVAQTPCAVQSILALARSQSFTSLPLLFLHKLDTPSSPGIVHCIVIFIINSLLFQPNECENAYFKMDNVLIDDRRIHVDFSQSVAKVKWKGKGEFSWLFCLIITFRTVLVKPDFSTLL
jgi:hypothetical protein